MNVKGRRCIHPGFRPFIFGAPKSCLVLAEKRLSSFFSAPLASFLERWVSSLPQPRFAAANGKQIGMQEFVTSVDHVPLFHLFPLFQSGHVLLWNRVSRYTDSTTSKHSHLPPRTSEIIFSIGIIQSIDQTDR